MPLIISFIIGLCNYISDKRYSARELKKLLDDNTIIIQTRSKFEEDNKAKREYNKKVSYENEQIRNFNNQLITNHQLILAQYEIDYKKAYNKYQLNCTAYQAQIDSASKSLEELKGIRDKMYALDILPPDYCELKHLHYFEHYFRNRLVDNITDAVIMYRQEAFQEMVGLSLGNILASINSLTGEVRLLGMSLQKIQTEVGVISSEVFRGNLIQEKLLDTVQEGFDSMQFSADSLMEETRAQRYATEAIKESTSRLAWYEQQRYYGYM